VSIGLTLDAGALIAFERGDRRVLALLERAREHGAELLIPAVVLAQVLRVPARQVALMRLVRQPRTNTVALDRAEASFVGQLLGSSSTSDIADAHVVVCARRARHAVVTSDAGDLRRLDPDLALVEV
jgi:predicted nucleic acid-binding protein